MTLMFKVKKGPLSLVTLHQDSKTMGDARKAKWTVYFRPDVCSRKGLCISLILGQCLLFFRASGAMCVLNSVGSLWVGGFSSLLINQHICQRICLDCRRPEKTE